VGEWSGELDHMSFPLHVVFVKHTFGTGQNECLRYLWINGYGDDDFTLEGAKRQIAHLVAYLSNKANLVTLTPEELDRM
jgi:hypothetical protein